MLDCLQEVEISEMSAIGREADFMQPLFSWATALKKMTKARPRGGASCYEASPHQNYIWNFMCAAAW